MNQPKYMEEKELGTASSLTVSRMLWNRFQTTSYSVTTQRS